VRAGARKWKIVVQRKTVTTDDYGGEIETWAAYATAYAAIFYGSGREQREAAQEVGVQPASFEIPSNSKTRLISVTDRLCYPVSAADPGNWPVWDITAVSDLGFNEDIRITATRAAT
jgi:head-tail adaptor